MHLPSVLFIVLLSRSGSNGQTTTGLGHQCVYTFHVPRMQGPVGPQCEGPGLQDEVDDIDESLKLLERQMIHVNDRQQQMDAQMTNLIQQNAQLLTENNLFPTKL